jgi:hypothetical protein
LAARIAALEARPPAGEIDLYLWAEPASAVDDAIAAAIREGHAVRNVFLYRFRPAANPMHPEG